MNSPMEMKEMGLAINKALFDKNSDELIKLISAFMHQNNLKTSSGIVQKIPLRDDVFN